MLITLKISNSYLHIAIVWLKAKIATGKAIKIFIYGLVLISAPLYSTTLRNNIQRAIKF